MPFLSDQPGTPRASRSIEVCRQCPVCGSLYGKTDVTPIESHKGITLAHITCHTCASTLLTLTIVTPFGMGSIAALTDIDKTEVTILNKKSTITEDDVLLFHTFLQSDPLPAKLFMFQ